MAFGINPKTSRTQRSFDKLGEYIMNVKAEKFDKMLQENKIECFQKQELTDELHTVLYRSSMEIEGVMLPVIVIIDDSIYTIFRTLINSKGVNENNRPAVEKLLNTLNATYKAFKYILTEAGEIILDTCLPSSNDNFDPNLIRVMIDVAIKNLNENYRKVMITTWNEEKK